MATSGIPRDGNSSQGNNLENTTTTNAAHASGISATVPPPDETTFAQPSQRVFASDDLDGYNSVTHDTLDTNLTSVIDILPHDIIDHNDPETSARRHGIPAVNSALDSHGIRVIFRGTDNVFAASSHDLFIDESLGTSKPSSESRHRRPARHAKNNPDTSSASSSFDFVESPVKTRKKRQNRPWNSAQSAVEAKYERKGMNSDSDFDEPETSTEVSNGRNILDYTVNYPAFDRPEGEESRHDYKKWNWYRGGFGVDHISVWRLLECKFDRMKLRIGVNMMFDTKTLEGEKNQDSWSKRFKDGKCDLTLNGIMHIFYTVPNLLHFLRQRDRDTLTVELAFQSIFQSGSPTRATCIHSQLRNRLGYILLHEEPAVALYDGDIDAGIQLLTFDILSATIDCWIDFLKLVRLRSAWKSYSFKDIETTEKYRPLLGDRANVDDFVRSTRDLHQAVETTIDKINAGINDGEIKFNKEQKSRFENIVRKRRNEFKVLQCKMDDVKDNMENMAERTKALADEKQDQSVKRLTLVASIFLPLTTACSLLSMTNRVVDIGALWWDWLGIVAIIGFVVLVGYRITETWDNYWHESDKQATFRGLKLEWNKARKDVLRKERKKKKVKGRKRKQHTDRKSRFTMAELEYRHAPLVPPFNRSMFQLAPYLFSMGAVASFLIGMFVDVSLGARSLGYSAAGTLGIVIGGIAIWRFLKAVDQILFKTEDPQTAVAGTEAHDGHRNTEEAEIPRDRKTAVYQATKRQAIRFGTAAVAKSSQRTTGPGVMTSLRFMCKLIYRLLSVFFGKLVFKITLKTLRNKLKKEQPDRRVDREGHHEKKPMKKRGDKDVEANRSHNCSPDLTDSSSDTGDTSEYQSGTPSMKPPGKTSSRKKRRANGNKHEQDKSREKDGTFVTDDTSTKNTQLPPNITRH